MKKLKTLFKNILKLMAVLIILFKMVSFINNNQEKGSSLLNTDSYSSQYIYMVERESENVAYEKNAHKKTSPASFTKIMTTLVALENIGDLSTIAPIDVNTYQNMVENNASMAGFFGREKVTYRDLLYGTILSSGGEAANSLAINIAGSVTGFVQMMNDKAELLGLKNTHFTNPEGLHDKNQYTTAHDMAKLLDSALENGHFRAIFTRDKFSTTITAEHPEGIILESTVLSHLNQKNYEGFDIIGGKSGTTYEAGQCWATLGLVGNEEYICIVMGAPLNDISQPDQAQIKDTINLFTQIDSAD